ncbi:hypothetical protein MKW98_001658 [Papaver atlanticum]|uniref:Uncharacterized protein n=1 Tax=Papaver atlanticum TaxID=357466 RepID=A0AAD4X8Z5_9MAGN|nr:hypothetical protein MKW98_001658 [Papaver atlanticum]
MLSMVSNITTVNGVCSDSNSSSNSPRGSNKRRREETSSSRFKGVYRQKKGKWGAQIYVKKDRYWLGTFKSESDAAMAYDSATVHFRSEDSPRNYPPQTSLEPGFQNLFQREELLTMLRDGIYQTKFNEFVNSRSLNQPDDLSLSLSTTASANDAAVSYQQLFQKELTPSDVGKLNRLVIPRRFAEKYFPEVSKEEKHPGVIDDIQLSFFDREMKRWTFRYCYWRSSQSYVFTRGWSRFVKDKKLEAKDVVTFYKCQKEQKAYYMIDVEPNGSESNGGFVGTYAAGSSVDFGQVTVKESAGAPQPEGEEVKKAVRLFGVNIKEGCLDSNSSNISSHSPRGSNKRHRQDISATPSARFKGVVSQPNGRWGAQIYVKKERIWIGTFKSESEAAMAYDSATVHLRSQDSPRNYPLTPQTSLEPDFQKLFSREEILSMLRDGLYQTKFNEFLNSRSLNQDQQPDGLSLSLSTNDTAVTYQQLFQKELTPSDVGKLNRLVIPKRFAEKYFPEVSKEEKHPGVIDDIQLSFFDREIKCWKFRYCYWRSSQNMKLKEKDMVTFYKCRKEQKAYYMIDVAPNGAESNGGSVGTYAAAGNRVDLQLGISQISINESGSSDGTSSTLMQEDMEVAPPQREEEEEKKAVRLFGVNIS